MVDTAHKACMQVHVLSRLAVSNWQNLQYFQNKRAPQPSVVFKTLQNKMHSSLLSLRISFILKPKQNHDKFFFSFFESALFGTEWHRRLYTFLCISMRAQQVFSLGFSLVLLSPLPRFVTRVAIKSKLICRVSANGAAAAATP